MLWKSEGKQLLRTPLRTAAFCLALAVVIGLLCITLGLQTATTNAITAVEEQYTTVGVLKSSVGSRSPFYMDLFVHKTLTLTQMQSLEKHSALLAYEPSLQTVTSAGISDGEVGGYDRPNNLALFAVTCTGHSFRREATQISQSGNRINVKVYAYQFQVKEVGHLHAEMPVPQTLAMESTLNLTGGLPFFEVGETYWICGFYEPIGESNGTLTLHRESYLQTGLWETSGVIYRDEPTYNTQYRMAMIGKYSGPLEANEDTAVREMWEKTLETLEISTHTLLIRTANRVSETLHFASGANKLLEGNVFTEEDITQGNRVAIISEILAENNGLEVGDTIELSFYNASYIPQGTYLRGTFPYLADIYGDNKNHHDALITTPEKHASNADGSYTVVGIYSSENGIVDDYHVLHPNTVLLPQSAMPRFFGMGVDFLDYTFVLPNGGIDAFEEELASYGHGEIMEYYDGGYSVIMPNIEAIRDSARFFNRITVVLWVIVVITVLTLLTLMLVPAGRVKYRLGVGKRMIWGQMSFSTVITLLTSGVLGCVGGMMLYDRAINWMMQSEFTAFNTAFSTESAHTEMLEQLLTILGQEPRFFVIATAVQVAILCIAGMILCAVASFRKTGFKQ